MKCFGLQAGDVALVSEEFLHSLADVRSGIVSVSDGENLFRSNVVIANEIRDAGDEHLGLAGTSTRDHEHGAVDVFDSASLLRCGGMAQGQSRNAIALSVTYLRTAMGS